MGIAGALSACATPPATKAALITAPPSIPAAQAAAPTLSFAPEQPAPAQTVADGPEIIGTASWYRTGYRLHRTYSGQILNNNAFTAASTVLPMGTVVRVARIDDSRSVIVRVNDRMPYNHRVIDLSEIAARELGMMGCGVTTVTVTPVEMASAP